MKGVVIFRGGGDVSTGSIQKLFRSGFQVLVLEIAQPQCVRRTVSLSEAVYSGIHRVEEMEAGLVKNPDEAFSVLAERKIPVLVDPEAKCIPEIKPFAVVDATIAKRNIGTNRSMAPITIALGPGYEAGADVDFVIETNRGHQLGRVIEKGFAAENTGLPGVIEGFSAERVYYAPKTGIIVPIKQITSIVNIGDVLATVDGVPVRSKLNGLVRGMMRDGIQVREGIKIADVDPRFDNIDSCFTISDKARNIGGGTLEAIFRGLHYYSDFNYHFDKVTFSQNGRR